MSGRVHIKEITRVQGGYRIDVATLATPLVVTRELVEKHRLKEGIVITAAQLEQLQHEAELGMCDREVGRLLAMREHSVGEVKAKLARKQFGSEVVNRTIDKYRKQGLLDDAHYAQAIARRLLERNPCGQAYLVASLRRKLIDRALAEKTAEFLLAGRDEVELARTALEKRWSRFGQFELETARRKAYNYLSRRGIGYAAAKTAFETLYSARKVSEEDKDI